MIESVQRQFTSKISGLENFDYWTRLQRLRLFSQERRRERYMILFLWKISVGKVSGYDIYLKHSDRRGRYVVPKNNNDIMKPYLCVIREFGSCNSPRSSNQEKLG